MTNFGKKGAVTSTVPEALNNALKDVLLARVSVENRMANRNEFELPLVPNHFASNNPSMGWPDEVRDQDATACLEKCANSSPNQAGAAASHENRTR